MPLATLNGVGIIELRLAMPRVGIWHAEITADAQADVDRLVTLDINEQLTLKGHVRHQGVSFDTLILDVVGGVGDMGTEAPKKNYREVSLQRILNDLLNAADESISPKVASSLKSLQVDRWSLAGGRTIGAELSALVDELVVNGAWRFMADGSLWLGVDQFKQVRPAYDLIREAPQQHLIEIVSDDFLVQPGDSLPNLDSPNVSYARHEVVDGQLRSTLYFEQA